MDLARVIDGKKFMWDGATYETEEEAKKVQEGYEKDEFEVRRIEEERKHYLFTRRVVTEVVVEGPPPM
ncbi:hypothetical protein AMJ39_03505 [candidate division TA06 bacterium DG_24]|jgi:hypothetical protein|uniref:Uncharacterized protein n=3 Tax=Bacteria division TA06 TaxID=1156500 RepID=A0A0S8JL30_UNCT6|nr:MAG: hypothetical protein AMJ39_03505 [candidate division TA06 bacterium DG_24]KPK70604.1 MAG: hypothetical protein AMJ82_02710 [candidate division TA06 bacterium SM23_40]KPL10449.1 MAG: hypothetical protein AMJ71_03045 [candidate division TA06 bacterium SM1_40]